MYFERQEARFKVVDAAIVKDPALETFLQDMRKIDENFFKFLIWKAGHDF